MGSMRRHGDYRIRDSWQDEADRAALLRRLKRRVATGVPIAVVAAVVISMLAGGVAPGQSTGTVSTSNASLASLLLPGSAAMPSAGSVSTTAAAPVRHAAQRHFVANAPTVTRHGAHRAESYRIATESDLAMVPSRQVVAHLEHSTPGYPSRDALQKNRTVPGSWYGYPSILPVIAHTRDRLKVRLAQRPDEATTWISRASAVLTVTHWAILVNITQHWLYVFHDGIQQASFPVGNGASSTPTPTGTYFVAFHAPPNGPGYGSVMIETSAHSRVFSHFEGGNDAIIAIHGPVGSDAQIGNNGAAISNGCIRMHDWDLNQVRHVPNGAPVILTSY